MTPRREDPRREHTAAFRATWHGLAVTWGVCITVAMSAADPQRSDDAMVLALVTASALLVLTAVEAWLGPR